MKILAPIGIGILRLIYFFIKLFTKTTNQITFISRQESGYSLDFDLETTYLNTHYPEYKTIILFKTLHKSLGSILGYIGHLFKQMKEIARSKVVVIDGYCIAVSVLHHKKGLVVIQMWHALGSLKKFGFSILDQKEGRSKSVADAMHMHKGYDYILASSKLAAKNFQEAFNATSAQMVVMGLPRMDYLQSKEVHQRINARFKKIYPECSNGRKLILYGPTMRTNCEVDYQTVINNLDLHKYNLMIKLHDGKELVFVDGKQIERGINFAGIEALHLADYFISDYSAMIYEAAIVRLPIYLYIYDYDSYMQNRGLYLDFKQEMPGYMSNSIQDISQAIENNVIDNTRLQTFLKRYITNVDKNITEELAKFIVARAKGVKYEQGN